MIEPTKSGIRFFSGELLDIEDFSFYLTFSSQAELRILYDEERSWYKFLKIFNIFSTFTFTFDVVLSDLIISDFA